MRSTIVIIGCSDEEPDGKIKGFCQRLKNLNAKILFPGLNAGKVLVAYSSLGGKVFLGEIFLLSECAHTCANYFLGFAHDRVVYRPLY